MSAAVARRSAKGALAPIDPEHLPQFAGEFMDAGLDIHDPAVPHPMGEEIGWQYRVADLGDMRAGIGQADDAAVAEE